MVQEDLELTPHAVGSPDDTNLNEKFRTLEIGHFEFQLLDDIKHRTFAKLG